MDTLTARCAIAGGGPAGIMLGLMLARSGVDVVVLEKWPDFFRDFRGDTIHPSTMEVLRELGLLDEFLALPHNKTRRMAGHIGGQEIVIADFSYLRTREKYIAFIPQWDFLNFLAAKAKALPNFRLLMETEALDLLQENGRTVGIRAKNSAGEFDIRAELVVGADGRHSMVREKAKLHIEDMGAPIDVLWFRIPQDPTDTSDESFGYVNHGKILIMLDRDGYWQCGYIIEKGEFEHIKERGIEAFQEALATLAPFVRNSVSEIKDWDQVKLLTVTVDHLTRWYGEGVLCLGDAAHAMSPIGGIGINLAIQDSVAAANVLIPAFKKGVPTTADFLKIQKRREVPTRRTQRLQIYMHTRFIAPILKNKGRTSLPFPVLLLKHMPILRWIPAHFVGIGLRPEHVKKFSTFTQPLLSAVVVGEYAKKPE